MGNIGNIKANLHIYTILEKVKDKQNLTTDEKQILFKLIEKRRRTDKFNVKLFR